MNTSSSAHLDHPNCSIPALNPRARYFSRLSARSALYTDLRLLFAGLQEPLSPGIYRQFVLDENRLFRSSFSARSKLWKELRSRYILDSSHPLFLAFWKEWKRCKSEQEFALTAYALFALNDRLVADIGKEWLFPNIRRAPHEIRVDDLLHFIDNKAGLQPEINGWSLETKNASPGTTWQASGILDSHKGR